MDAACNVLKTRMDESGYSETEMNTNAILDGYSLCLAILG